MTRTQRIDRLHAAIARCEAKIDAAYWAFTRQRRARPPVLVVPKAYEERARLRIELNRLRRELGPRGS